MQRRTPRRDSCHRVPLTMRTPRTTEATTMAWPSIRTTHSGGPHDGSRRPAKTRGSTSIANWWPVQRRSHEHEVTEMFTRVVTSTDGATCYQVTRRASASSGPLDFVMLCAGPVEPVRRGRVEPAGARSAETHHDASAARGPVPGGRMSVAQSRGNVVVPRRGDERLKARPRCGWSGVRSRQALRIAAARRGRAQPRPPTGREWPSQRATSCRPG